MLLSNSAQSTLNSRQPNSNSTDVAIQQQQQLHNRPRNQSDPVMMNNQNGGYLAQFEPLFHPISELPPPDPFMNKPKYYPSQKAQQKQQQKQQLSSSKLHS